MQTSVSVCHDMASHPEMLTDKELTSVTASFKALESGLRGATIKQEVGQIISLSTYTHNIGVLCSECSESNVDGWTEPL